MLSFSDMESLCPDWKYAGKDINGGKGNIVDNDKKESGLITSNVEYLPFIFARYFIWNIW